MQKQIINTIRLSLSAAQSALELLEQVEPRNIYVTLCSGEAGVDKDTLTEAGVAAVVAEAVTDSDDVVKSTSAVETAAVETAAVETAAVETAAVETAAVPSKLDIIMAELRDPRYKLRTHVELAAKSGLLAEDVEELLRDNNVSYVRKNRRSDRAVLLGLTERQ